MVRSTALVLSVGAFLVGLAGISGCLVQPAESDESEAVAVSQDELDQAVSEPGDEPGVSRGGPGDDGDDTADDPKPDPWNIKTAAPVGPDPGPADPSSSPTK